MAEILQYLCVLLALLSSTLAAKPFRALVAPISQSDPSSPFTITLNKKDKFVVDIESPLSFHHCSKRFPLVSCHTSQCLAAQSCKSPFCHVKIPKTPPKPAKCNCYTLPSNPITKTCALSLLTYTNVSINSTDGFNPISEVHYNKIFMSCAPKSLIRSLPKGSSGLASLSKGSLSIVSQFSSSKVSKKFGMCLSNNGVAFFGDGPFDLALSSPGTGNLTDLLSYTPLLKQPNDPLGYYIGLKGIAVNGQPVKFLKRMLPFDALGKGGVKLSTITPYTTLRSDVFRALINQYTTATRGIPKVPKVDPFGLCLNSTFIGSSRFELIVPNIDLELSNGKNWSMSGFSIAKQVSNDVACLAFVDGGEKAEQAMVIGLYQMQQNFLLFDLENHRLGFTELVFYNHTNCMNFDFRLGGKGN